MYTLLPGLFASDGAGMEQLNKPKSDLCKLLHLDLL